jgi:hypothetical protein
MGKLITVAALAVVTSASAIGVGVYFDYNPLGIVTAPDYVREPYDISFIGFDGGFELKFHEYVAFVTGVGFQRFSWELEYWYYTIEGSDSFVPVTFGVEFPLAAGNIVICPGVGSGITFFQGDGSIIGEDYEIWAGCRFYYMLNPNLGLGTGVTYTNIFTDPDPVSWLHVPVGFKYWFM